MAIGICIVLLLTFVILYLKAKLMNYVFALWMAENNFPGPEEEDAEMLARKVADGWFKRKEKEQCGINTMT